MTDPAAFAANHKGPYHALSPIPVRFHMRLTPRMRRVILETSAEVFGASARVKLFGSRTYDSLKEGNIDLLVELPHVDPDRRRKSLTLVGHLQMRLGDQPIDAPVIDPATPRQPIREAAQATGIPL